ncbi:beta-galactosidase [uncultured Dysgonomonas sp.]|uniref:Glycoside hydrolase family 42 N-terminal domain-containing protein n=1 Tax=uncultured Dysgonomonas sp. TaxID=206096 RepID=A0A212JCT1_9BACT|nr:beta-galactosidase [uncultured Dysgonomonas sp.]SBV97241.1 conserved exported hypothetical protein [uncultured Dysgonomonas sp.]
MKNLKKVLLIFTLLGSSLFTSYSQTVPNIGAEIWIEPGQTKEQIYDWFRLMDENKMYSARLFVMWNYIETQPGTFDFSLYDWAFDAANKYGVKIEATLCAIHGPVFYNQKFHGRPQYNELFDSEYIKEKAAVFIEKTVNRYKADKALGYWWILNEPRSFLPDSELATKRLQEWAKNKYKNIEEVNNQWIESYKDFSDIKFDPLWTKGSYFYWPVPAIDWYLFHRDFLTENLKWIADEVRKHDKSTPLTTNPAGVFEYAHLYDFPKHREIFNVLGASMHAAWQLRSLQREQYAYAVAGISEILRGSNMDGEFWMSELQGGNNIWSGRSPMCPDPKDLSQWIWTGVGSGAKKIIYWSLNYRRQGIESGEWGLLGFRNEPTERSVETKNLNSAMIDNQDFLKNAKPLKNKISLILSPESMRVLLHINSFNAGARGLDAHGHMRSLLMWFIALQEKGYQIDIRHLRDYEWDSEEVGRVAILSNIVAVPNEMVPKLEKFVNDGNYLIAEGLTGFFDEYETNTFQTGFPLENLLGGRMIDIPYRNDKTISFKFNGIDIPGYVFQPILQPLTGVSAGEMNGSVFAINNKTGKGKTLWLPAVVSMGAYPNNTEPLSLVANSLLEEYLQKQPFYFQEYTKGGLLRILKNGNSYLTVVTNNRQSDIALTLVNQTNLKPQVIYGNETSYLNGKLSLKDRETIVILWK